MGIKGIYKELGPGQRISLAKLAVEHLERTGQPLRVAIDVSIWQFQIRAAQGGTNPALRTFFYRLLRLLTLAIHPLFVFDGPKRPQWKRNKNVGGPSGGDRVGTAMAKNLIALFGFLPHDAPGEAEAECAFLQREGIVDAVLSEDVDTIMFGCGRTIRNWSAEGKGGIPTHVNCYEAKHLNMDREGMVLVALMSGGDYITEGIPGCGVKVACEAARAGFGVSLCRIKTSAKSGSRPEHFAVWREDLKKELETNESKFFRTKHKALQIPEDFPNIDVLRCYTHPVVSPATTIGKLKALKWNRPVDIASLREFTRNTFDWNFRAGSLKFVKVLAPGVLVKRLLQLPDETATMDEDDLRVVESCIVKSIKSRRTHISTDEIPELRISYIPTEIVGYDPYEEEEEVVESSRGGLALNSDDDFDEEDDEGGSKGPAKIFKASEPNLIWISESVIKICAPITADDWELALQAKRKKKKPAKASKSSKTTSRKKVDAGSIDNWVSITKDIVKTKPVLARDENDPEDRPPPSKNMKSIVTASNGGILGTSKSPARSRKPAAPRIKKTSQPVGPDPWRLAGSRVELKTTKIAAIPKPKPSQPFEDDNEPIIIPSSPVTPISPFLENIVSPRRTPRKRNVPSNATTPRRIGKSPKVSRSSKAKGMGIFETKDGKRQMSITSFMTSPSPIQAKDKIAKTGAKRPTTPKFDFSPFLSDEDEASTTGHAFFSPHSEVGKAPSQRRVDEQKNAILAMDDDELDTSGIYHTAEESFHIEPSSPSRYPTQAESLLPPPWPYHNEEETAQLQPTSPPQPSISDPFLSGKTRAASIHIISSSPVIEARQQKRPEISEGGDKYDRPAKGEQQEDDQVDDDDDDDDGDDYYENDLPTLESLAPTRNLGAEEGFINTSLSEDQVALTPPKNSSNRHITPIDFHNDDDDDDDDPFFFSPSKHSSTFNSNPLSSTANIQTRDLSPDRSWDGSSSKNRPRMTRLYVSSGRNEGYVDEIEVPAHRAEEEMRVWEGRLSRGQGQGGMGGGMRRVWRRSDVHVVDLTGEE